MNLLLKRARLFVPAIAALALVAAPAFAFAHDDSGSVSGTVATQTMVALPLQGTGVFIGGNGNALVRGAKVTGISGSTITAQSAWGSAAISWTVNAANAKFYDSRVASSTLGSISTGDTISFGGALNQAVGAFTVNATAIRDWSKTTPVATSTPTHPLPHPFFPRHFWDSIKADLGLHFGLGHGDKGDK